MSGRPSVRFNTSGADSDRWGQLVWVCGLRGDGQLRVGDQSRPVGYELDLFRQGSGFSLGGDAWGDLAGLSDTETFDIVLVTADGAELALQVAALDEDGANLRMRADPASRKAAGKAIARAAGVGGTVN